MSSRRELPFHRSVLAAVLRSTTMQWTRLCISSLASLVTGLRSRRCIISDLTDYLNLRLRADRLEEQQLDHVYTCPSKTQY
jgi:hypothetical protein